MRASNASTPLTHKQLTILRVAKKQLGLGDDTYRDVLQRVTSCNSSVNLTQPSFIAVIKYFTAMRFCSTWTKRSYGYRPTVAMPAQADIIRWLWAKFLGREDENEMELNKWLDQFHKVSSFRFVDKKSGEGDFRAPRYDLPSTGSKLKPD